MAELKIDDHIRFETMTPDGKLTGTGRIAKIFPVGRSAWLHVAMDDGWGVRMLFEATTKMEVLEAEVA